MFFIIGVCLTFFLTFLLFIKKKKSRADKILIIWLLLIAISQLSNYLIVSEIVFKYPHFLGVWFSVPIMIGVFLYFYVSEITGNVINKFWRYAVHFTPAIALIILAYPFYKLTGEEKIFIFKNEGVGFEWYTLTLNITIGVSGLAYSIWSLFIILKHQKSIKDRFSNTDKKELQWLRLLIIGFAVIWVVSMFFGNLIIYIVVAIFVLLIAIFGINQLTIFNSSNLDTNNLKEIEFKDSPSSNKKQNNKPDSTLEKYAKSGLSEDMASEIYTKLKDVMKDSSFYKNEELTLAELSKRLKTHPNHLSQVINEMEGKNFYNYINSLRINEFIKLAQLPENKKYTMISLAYDCGFSTKSTFNKHFKLNTGKTPTEFFNS